MTTAFPDRLAEAVRRTGTALCVGLDPRWGLLPRSLRERFGADSLEAAAAAVEAFCLRVVEIVAGLAPVVKAQMAFFEWLGPAGLAALQKVIQAARAQGLLVILDGKRGDIASTAEAYAEAAFGGVRLEDRHFPVWDVDAVTINPFLGRDAVEPFLRAARTVGGGLFVLVRTSNPGGGMLQELACAGRPLYRYVADAVAEWNASGIGACGLGDVGAVVGATHARELAELRSALPDAWLLVPGYGAQGGTAADVRAAFRADGLGAVVNSSRGVTFSFAPDDPAWEAAIQDAARRAAADLALPRDST